MFGFTKSANTPRRVEGRATYRQVAVTPEAHKKLKEIADKRNATIVDTVDRIVGV